MNTTAHRAREIARSLDSRGLSVSPQIAEEVAGMLHTLADFEEYTQLRGRMVELALNYYSRPDQYFQPVQVSQPILDGGLRARTALRYLRGSTRVALHAFSKES